MQSTPSRLSAEVEYFTERAQAEIDERETRAWERRERIEASVTFDDLLEELAGIDCSAKIMFMGWLARGNRTDLHWLHVELSEAKERITKRRMAQGE